MNYYEHHLGDYLRDTAHLSMLEDGAYRRLLDAYYIRETLLPLAEREVFRLVRAQTKQDREAVQTVLREFFTETPEGWRHSRCDREIERFQDKQRKARASAEARWSQRPAQSEGNANAHANASPDAMRTHSEGNAPRARPQTPDTRHHTHSVAELPHGGESAKPPAAVAAPASRGSRLPKDWTPEPEQQAFAESLGIRNGVAAAELAKFRDYWAAQPGQKGVKTDWTATWRNWLRRVAESGGAKQAAPAGDIFDGVH